MSILKPSESVMASAAVIGLVYGAFQIGLPNAADIRQADAPDDDIEKSKKAAAWGAATLVSAAAVITKDPTIFVFGGATVVALYWYYTHANYVDPLTGQAKDTAKSMIALNGSAKAAYTGVG